MVIEELQKQLNQIFRDWGKELNNQEREALKEQAFQCTDIDSWRNKHIALVVTSGVTAGVMGGPWSYAAILGDILWCRKVSPLACLGIGYILDCEVDVEHDMNMIMAIWSGVGVASVSVPIGKVGVKTSPKICMKVGAKVVPKIAGKGAAKVAEKVVGKVIGKTALKSSSKVLAKLTSKIVNKGVAKVTAKLATKVGVGWIPIIGGIVSGGINYWLLNGLMDAAYEYYSNDYVVFEEAELSVALL